MAAAPVAAQATEVDWELEEASARDTAMMEIAKRDPESELYRDPARQPRQHLHILNLKNLREIPTRVFELSSITGLMFAGDHRKESPLRLSVIPSEIGQLTNLGILDISRNSLPTLPESISQLTRMQSLSLKENGLIQLPAGIGNLQRLKVCCVAVSCWLIFVFSRLSIWLRTRCLTYLRQ